MNQGRVPAAPGSHPTGHAACGVDGATRVDPSRGEPFKVLSLFAGIGGFDLGLERTGGFKTVAFCEIDPFCQKVLAKHWPGVPCYHDVRDLTAERLAADGIAVDCIVGGFPCQDISTAGRGAGIEGERSGLWSEYARLIGELRPSVVIVENVAALLGRGLDSVLGTLASIGYDAEWHCIPASAVGAPHERDRVWIVAYPAETIGRALIGKCGLARQHSVLAERAEDAGRASEFPEATWRRPWREITNRLSELDDGVSRGFHGFDALANAVVHQIPELIGRAILEARA